MNAVVYYSNTGQSYAVAKYLAERLGYPALEASTRAEAAQKQTECRNRLRVLGNVDLEKSC